VVLRRHRRRGIQGAHEGVRSVLDPHEVLVGTVRAFDEHVGLGVVALEQHASVPFHCIVIDDGSRSVAVGTRVLVRVGASFRGTLEATWIHKLPDDEA
jgi:cold shock CspA family protein